MAGENRMTVVRLELCSRQPHRHRVEEFVSLSDLIKELGIEPLPIHQLVATVTAQRRLPFCELSLSYLAHYAEEAFALPLFTYVCDGKATVIDCFTVHVSANHPITFCFHHTCSLHPVAGYPERAADTVVVVSRPAILPLLVGLTRSIDVYSPVVDYSLKGMCESYRPLRGFMLPWCHFVRRTDAERFIGMVRASGGVDGFSRQVLAELIMDGRALIKFEHPYRIIAVNELLGSLLQSEKQSAVAPYL
jgi:hypothetical protein